MSHRVLSAFKLVYGHLNSIFLTGNFAWAYSRHFTNSGQKDRAKFPNFDPCTVCGKMFQVSGGVYLPAFWATLPYHSITCFLGHTPYYNYEEPMLALLAAIWMSSQCLLPLVVGRHYSQLTFKLQPVVQALFFIIVISGVAQKADNTVIRGCGPKSR